MNLRHPWRSLALLFVGCSLLAAAAPGPDTTLPPPPDAAPAPEPPRDPQLPTLWIAGDSTAANGGPMATGWGVSLPRYFDPTKINVVNRSRGGRSSRTFLTEGLWDGLLAGVKPGDYVLIQFGHNDAGAINDTTRARGSLRSLGDETEEIDNQLTGRHEVVHTYGWYLRRMVAEVKARQAIPVVLSLTVRNEWKDGKVERANGPWRELAARLARQEHVAFIDLTRLIADEYERRGPAAVAGLFPRDHTHTSPAGGELNATLVVAGLRSLPAAPLDADLSDAGRAIAAAPAGSVVGAAP